MARSSSKGRGSRDAIHTALSPLPRLGPTGMDCSFDVVLNNVGSL